MRSPLVTNVWTGKSPVLWPLACGKNLAPTAQGPVTVVEVVLTSTPSNTATAPSPHQVGHKRIARREIKCRELS